MSDTQNLIEWTIRFLKHQDIIKKEIKEIVENKDNVDLLIEYINKKMGVLILPDLVEINKELPKLKSFKKQNDSCIVTLNKKENLNILIKTWDKISEFDKRFKLIFVNLDNDQKWIIFPWTHNLFSEKESLNMGLQSLFDSIGEMSSD